MLGSAGFNNWPWPIKTTAALTKIIRNICCKMLQDVGDLNSQTLEPMATSHAMRRFSAESGLVQTLLAKANTGDRLGKTFSGPSGLIFGVF